MFIPIHTDRPPRHAPAVTMLLIAINVLIYAAGQLGQVTGHTDVNQFISLFHFDPAHFRAWQLLTYQFMYDPSSIWHVVFNMLLLCVFGCSVECRLGSSGF